MFYMVKYKVLRHTNGKEGLNQHRQANMVNVSAPKSYNKMLKMFCYSQC